MGPRPGAYPPGHVLFGRYAIENNRPIAAPASQVIDVERRLQQADHPAAEGGRGSAKLTAEPLPSGLDDHGDGRALAGLRHSLGHGRRVIVQGASRPQQGDRLADLMNPAAGARDIGNGADFADPGRASRRPPGAGAEIIGDEAADTRVLHRRALLGTGLGRGAEPLGHGQDGGQGALPMEPAVVMFAPRADPSMVNLEFAHPAEERQVEKLGQGGADLSRIGVDRIAPGEDQIERPLPRQGGGQAARRGQAVGAGEGGIADQHAAVGAPGDGLAQHLPGALRPEAEGGAAAAGCARQLDPLGHRAPAIGVEIELDPIPLQAPVGGHGHGLEARDLLDQDGDFEAAHTIPVS